MAVEIAAERPDSPEAEQLILELQAHLEPRYPPASRHGFSVRRLVDEGVDFYVLRSGGAPAACGGVLIVPPTDADVGYGEIKRMYVRPAFRGAGFARAILERLAQRAREQGVAILRLETGIHQVEAIRLYERSGFRTIPPFGPYVDDPLSRFFEKRLA
jgi:putative acetyltransferase